MDDLDTPLLRDSAESKDDSPGVEADDGSKKLGTISGVFLPCVQNIMGVILFLRLPWIAGQAGGLLAMAIVLLCALSTTLTALSMSAIVTNGRVPAGGPYFLVSRNVGPAFGGAIGLLFYVGTSVATSLYVLGAVEAFENGFLRHGFPFAWGTEAAALILTAVLAGIVFVGVKYVNMAASAFLAAVLLSVLCIYVGLFALAGGHKGYDINACVKGYDIGRGKGWLGHTFNCRLNEAHGVALSPEYSNSPGFGGLLAIFFPSVTGIMAGANRSDVLKTPSTSIPRGTLGAIAFTTTIYVSVVWLFAALVERDALAAAKGGIVITSAVAQGVHLDVVVTIGIIMSCIGAGLQTLTGAPRLLAAIASDDLMPCLNVFKAPPGHNPNRALVLTTIIAAVPCCGGNLNAVTPIVTLLFLAMYCTMNLACFLLSVLKEPTWRPRFHNSCPGMRRVTALLGVLLTLALMFVTKWDYAIALLIVTWLLAQYIGANADGLTHSYGDVAHGVRFQQARDALLRLGDVSMHTKSWKPQLLVLCKLQRSGESEESDMGGQLACIGQGATQVLRLANQLKKGRGLVLVRSIIEGDLTGMSAVNTTSQTGQTTSCVANADTAAVAARALRRAITTMGLSRHIRSARGISVSRSADIAAFANVIVARSVEDAMVSLAQDAGLGALGPNTVIMGWLSRSQAQAGAHTTTGVLDDERYVRALRGIVAAKRALIVVRGTFPLGERTEHEDSSTYHHDLVHVSSGTIDVWWLMQDGGLLLLLPNLLMRHSAWRSCTLRVFCVVPDDDAFHKSEVVDAPPHPHARPAPNGQAQHSTIELLPIDGTPGDTFGAVKSRVENWLSDLRFSATVKVVPLPKITSDCLALFCGSGNTGDYDDVVLPPSSRRSPSFMRHSPGGGATAAQARHAGLEALHEAMLAHSSDAELVVMNMPLSSPSADAHLPTPEQQTASQFLDIADTVSKGFKRALLVRGAGNSVVTADG